MPNVKRPRSPNRAPAKRVLLEAIDATEARLIAIASDWRAEGSGHYRAQAHRLADPLIEILVEAARR